jgi:integrase
VLSRAVAWGLLDSNPAKRGIPNRLRRSKEKRPFESWQQIDAIAERLSPVYGPMVLFAAAAGLRPSELFALEQRDIDRDLGVVYVRRAYANGRLKHTKTRLSTRAVPLQAIAFEALDRLPRSENPILFPNSRGVHVDFRVFGRRHWSPFRRLPASSRCVVSTTCATRTPPSRSGPESLCSRSRVSWVRAPR